MKNLKITIINQQRKVQINQELEEILQQALSLAFQRAFKSEESLNSNSDIDFSTCIILSSESEIQALNHETREIDFATDVLSFPSWEFFQGVLQQKLENYHFINPLSEKKELFLGDIVIAPGIALQQAEEYGHSFSREMTFLALHGLLHLIGYNHEVTEEENIMRQLQSNILDEIGLTVSFTESENKFEDLGEGKLKKVGFVSLLGRPNLGKSTLLNYINGSELAITSYKPQTTRDLIRCVITDEQRQIIFLDSPGIHRESHALDRYMTKAISLAMDMADVILLMVDARYKPKVEETERRVAKFAKERRKPLILVLNKVDIADKDNLLPLMDVFNKELTPHELVPISSKTGDGVELLLELITKYLPEQKELFAPDDYTNQSERTLAAELIRQQILIQMEEEIPHGTAVVIDDFEEAYTENEGEYFVRKSLFISATIICERQSHKGMLLGRGGSRIKVIRTHAQRKISNLLDTPTKLDLYVQVREQWRNRPQELQDIGYDITELEVE